jgi:hypothetical protein
VSPNNFLTNSSFPAARTTAWNQCVAGATTCPTSRIPSIPIPLHIAWVLSKSRWRWGRFTVSRGPLLLDPTDPISSYWTTFTHLQSVDFGSRNDRPRAIVWTVATHEIVSDPNQRDRASGCEVHISGSSALAYDRPTAWNSAKVLGTEPADHLQIEAVADRPGPSPRSKAQRPRLGPSGNAINGDPDWPAPTFAPSVVVAEQAAPAANRSSQRIGSGLRIRTSLTMLSRSPSSPPNAPNRRPPPERRDNYIAAIYKSAPPRVNVASRLCPVWICLLGEKTTPPCQGIFASAEDGRRSKPRKFSP